MESDLFLNIDYTGLLRSFVTFSNTKIFFSFPFICFCDTHDIEFLRGMHVSNAPAGSVKSA